MRAVSQPSSSSHSRFKAAWRTLAAGSLAGLAVLGACSDGPVASKASSADGPGVPDPRFVGVVGGNHHKVLVCVDLASSPGTYSFSAAALPTGVAPFPWYELMTSNDPDLSAFGVTQNSKGPFSATADNDTITANVNVTPGNCDEVFVRANTCVGGGVCPNPFDNPGNRLWTDVNGTTNPYGSVSITFTPPTGHTFTLACTNDDPGNPMSCTNGGYASANVFHGASFNYTITAPAETPCPAGSFTTSIADAAQETGWPNGGVGDLLIKYDQFPAPNDNSYGVNSVGWKPNRPHKFKDLVNSDHAGVQIKNASGGVVLSFNMDYLSAFSGAPSGYASLGVTGGDGSMLTGTATGISVTTSLANNLNNINIPGLFNPTTHVQLIGSVNVLVDSPPTDPAHQTYVISDPALAGWDFHNTYYARISAAKLAQIGFNASTWTVQPNASQLHNSPAKECPN